MVSKIRISEDDLKYLTLDPWKKDILFINERVKPRNT